MLSLTSLHYIQSVDSLEVRPYFEGTCDDYIFILVLVLIALGFCFTLSKKNQFEQNSKGVSLIALYFNKPNLPEYIAFRWTLSTAFISLSPFILAIIGIGYVGDDISPAFRRIIRNGSLVYSTISISSASYLDYLFSDAKVLDLFTAKRRRFTNLWFVGLTAFTLILYAPLQHKELVDNWKHIPMPVVLILVSIWFSLKVKTMIFNAEKELLA